MEIRKLCREIDKIMIANGHASPKILVEYARDKDTELYKCFTWDDVEAAKKWKLHNGNQPESTTETTDDAELAEQWRLHEASQLVLNLYANVF